MPIGSTTNDLRAFVKEYAIQKGVKPDVVLVDSFGLMMPLVKKILQQNCLMQDKFVTKN